MNIALIFDSKKTKKPEFVQLLEYLTKTQKNVIRLNPDGDMEEQVRDIDIDVLLMKITHLRSRIDHSALERVKEFYHKRPNMVVIDTVENTSVFARRSTLWSKVRSLSLKDMHIPRAKLLEEEKDALETLCPCICKPDDAESHSLTICRSFGDFKNVVQYPSYCEELVHHKVLHKVYVIDDKLFIHPRSSIKEISPETSTFDSQTLTKNSHDEESELTKEEIEVIRNFMKDIRNGIGISLFGLDIVKEEVTNKLYCIDINLFPGYTSFPDFPETVVSMLEKKVVEKRKEDKSG